MAKTLYEVAQSDHTNAIIHEHRMKCEWNDAKNYYRYSKKTNPNAKTLKKNIKKALKKLDTAQIQTRIASYKLTTEQSYAPSKCPF